jgi:hypothetical protein
MVNRELSLGGDYMRLIKTLCFSIVLTMLMTTMALANSTPVIIEEDPSFSIAPAGSTPIAVKSEYLEFDTTDNLGNSAKVTAIYEMINTSDETVEQKMLFPFITSDSKNFMASVRITANEQPVEFETLRLDDLPQASRGIRHNFKDNTNSELTAAVEINNIIKMLNQREYTPKNYSENQIVTVYTLHLPAKDKEYQAEVQFKLNPKKHKLLFSNVNGLSLNEDGSGRLTTWSLAKGAEAAGRNAYFTVLGEDSESIPFLKSITGQEITAETKTMGEFLANYIDFGSYIKYSSADTADLKAYILKQLDFMLSENDPIIDMEQEILSPYFFNTYVGAFLYNVTFKPGSSTTLKVEYEMQATRDRQKTRDYSNMFLYLLRPAVGWKDFGELTIKVIPSEAKPFIIESSLPLIKDNEKGFYTGHFDGLPDKDFYFVIYKTDQPDPPPVVSAYTSQIIYRMLAPALGMIVMMVLVAIVIRISRKKAVK